MWVRPRVFLAAAHPVKRAPSMTCQQLDCVMHSLHGWLRSGFMRGVGVMQLLFHLRAILECFSCLTAQARSHAQSKARTHRVVLL